MENNEKDIEKIENNNTNEKNINVETFISSLNSLSSEINGNTKTVKKKKYDRNFWIWFSALAICVSVFVVSVIMIGINMYEGHSSEKINNELNDSFFDNSAKKGLMPRLSPMVLDDNLPKYGSPRNHASNLDYRTLYTNNPLIAEFKEKLLEYKKINPDIYGWIQVDGTDISYAIVRGTDNDYYLNHTVTNEHNVNGSIFADFRVEDNVLDNPNIVFYGHNSYYLKQMFHQLTRFLDQSFFEENKYITIYTVDGIYRYEIFAIYETYSSYNYCQMNFVSEKSFVNWCNEMKSNSIHNREMTPFKAGSRIITLSTCANAYYTRRYSIQGRLVTIER